MARRAAQEGRRAGRSAPPSTHVRIELPIDVDACPPLDDAFHRALDAALVGSGMTIGSDVRAGLEAHARLLLAWSAAINLTAIRSPSGVALEHVADALAALPLLRRLGLPARPAVLDLGSGGGYPGLPVGLALPAGRLALVDSIGKKARFLRVAAAAAASAMTARGGHAPQIDVLAVRAEALAGSAEHRARWDVVTARAVGDLRELAELSLPLIRPGGWLVAWKRDGGDGKLAVELAAAEAALAVLGGVITGVEPVGVPGLEDHRLVSLRRTAPKLGRSPRSDDGPRRRAARAAC